MARKPRLLAINRQVVSNPGRTLRDLARGVNRQGAELG
jgi:hypothetical protein